jgi:hypothetical protein
VTMANLDDFLSRIQIDPTFDLQVRQSPDEALAAYELSTDERATVTGSRQQLWTRVGRSSSYWKIGCNYVMLGSDELEFNAAAVLGRPGIQNTIDEIRRVSVENDRIKPVLALMEQIG